MDNTKLAADLASLSQAVISTHVSPDADAIGSAVALQRGLASLGVEAKVFLEDPLPERFTTLVGDAPLVHELPKEKVPAVVVVDSASKKRVGKRIDALLALGETSFNIDHHGSNDCWAETNFVDSKAAASAIIVFDLLVQMGASVDSQTANLLFAGLMDDTGCFRFSNSDKRSFETAARLLEAGASPEYVANELYFSVPERVLRLRAKALANLRLVLDGRVAVLSVSSEMLDELQARPEDTEGLVEIARSVSGTIAAVFIRQLDSSWKLSLRSKTKNVNVNDVAAAFGGGGHAQAAGCTLSGSLEEVEAQVLEKLEKALPESAA